jgi:hypothetical protein
MTGLGTDLMAVACILGGAAVSGATTMAVVEGHRGHAEIACVGAAVNEHPRVVVALDGGKGTIVVAPRVWVHPGHECAAWSMQAGRSFRINMDEMRGRMERARARMEREQARMRAEQSRVDAVPSLDQADLGANISAQVQKQIQEQMKQLDQALAKLDAGTGR